MPALQHDAVLQCRGSFQWGLCEYVIHVVHMNLPPSRPWSSHSVDYAGRQAKMVSIEIWIPCAWRNAHKPHWIFECLGVLMCDSKFQSNAFEWGVRTRHLALSDIIAGWTTRVALSGWSWLQRTWVALQCDVSTISLDWPLQNLHRGAAVCAGRSPLASNCKLELDSKHGAKESRVIMKPKHDHLNETRDQDPIAEVFCSDQENLFSVVLCSRAPSHDLRPRAVYQIVTSRRISLHQLDLACMEQLDPRTADKLEFDREWFQRIGTKPSTEGQLFCLRMPGLVEHTNLRSFWWWSRTEN